MSLIKWTVTVPRQVAEDSRTYAEVEAESIEAAIKAAWHKLDNSTRVPAGQTFIVSARVEVMPPSTLPLRSV